MALYFECRINKNTPSDRFFGDFAHWAMYWDLYFKTEPINIVFIACVSIFYRGQSMQSFAMQERRHVFRT